MKKFKYIFIVFYIFVFTLIFTLKVKIDNLQIGLVIREVKIENQSLKTEYVLIYDQKIYKNEIQKLIIKFKNEKIVLKKKELIFKNNKIYLKHKNLNNIQDFQNNVVIYLNNQSLLKYILKYFKTSNRNK